MMNNESGALGLQVLRKELLMCFVLGGCSLPLMKSTPSLKPDRERAPHVRSLQGPSGSSSCSVFLLEGELAGEFGFAVTSVLRHRSDQERSRLYFITKLCKQKYLLRYHATTIYIVGSLLLSLNADNWPLRITWTVYVSGPSHNS